MSDIGKRETEVRPGKSSGTHTLLKIPKSKRALVLRKLGQTTDKPESAAGKNNVPIYKFDKERIVLGSVISSDVRLTGEGISPIHAVIEFNQGTETTKPSAVIFDLASQTGVYVNQKKAVTHKLADQDEITLGRYRFKFSMEDIDRTSKKDRIRETGERTLFLNPNEDLKPLLLEDERNIEEIFDYKSTSQRALEVVMSWSGGSGVILGVEHFVRESSVTVGVTNKSNFAIPPLLAESHFPLVTQKNGNFSLNLDSQMKGVIQRRGELKSLEEARNQTSRGLHGYEIPIENQDFAKISIGDIDFYLSFTPAPPRLKWRRLFDRDPFFIKIFVISMLLTVAALASLLKMNIPISVEAEQVPDRIATILYQPEKFLKPPEPPKPKPTPTPTPTPVPKETPIPTPKAETPPPVAKPTPKVVIQPKPLPPVPAKKPLPKVMDVKPVAKPEAVKTSTPPAKPAAQNRPAPKASGKEGEGARAKGTQGTRGEANKPKSAMKVTELSRPSTKPGDTGASGASTSSDDGNVDFLKGAGGKIQNILGNSAASLGEGSKNLKGFGNFATRGTGGLALSGSGTGGGGSAETTLGGLGNKGTGMGRVGTGKGAAGNGTGIVGAHARVSIRTDGPEEAVVMGAIDRDAVAEAIFAHKDEFRLCYEREINAENPDLAGQVSTSFVIGSSGRVSQAGIESSSLSNANVERCIISVLKRIQFPSPRGGGVVEVKFPFKFNAVGR